MTWEVRGLSQLPEAPKFSIPKIRRQQAEIKQVLLEDMRVFGELLNMSVLERLQAAIFRLMPNHRPDESSDANDERLRLVVNSFLQPLVGRIISNELVEELSLKLIEWLPRFERAEEYVSWDQQTPVWALIYVQDMERQLCKNGRLYQCRFQALAGVPAGIRWETFLQGGKLQQVLRSCGLPKYDKYPDHEFGGLYLIGYLSPDEHRINIAEVTASSSVKAYNKSLYKERRGKCIGGFWQGVCFNCPLGRDLCRLSRHLHTYTDDIECTNYGFGNGRRVYHRGYKIRRDQGVCLDCLNKGERLRPDTLQAFYNRKNKFKEGKSML